MTISDTEFDEILKDETKRISSDLNWVEDDDHSPARVFRVEVESDAGYPLVLVGRYNLAAGQLSFALVHRGAGRIYGLDRGAEHRNPDGTRIGEKHKHRGRLACRNKEAYPPVDITEAWDSPVEVWKQFCNEARISHVGRMTPPSVQEELPL